MVQFLAHLVQTISSSLPSWHFPLFCCYFPSC